MELLHTFETLWIRPYGNPDVIETDQESGLTSDEAKVYFDRLGITCRLKGVDSHAKMVEVHHRILRDTYHRIRTHAELEGLAVTKEHCLTCALTAKNNLFTVGSGTPMMAAFGRQSPVLPNIEQTTCNLDDTHTGPEGISRGRHRLQEIASQSMIEATAKERMNIAINTKTRKSAEATGLQAGDKVEFHRKSQNKDQSNWRGPAEILKIDRDGTTHIQWQGGSLTCQLQDIRKAMTYLLLLEQWLMSDATNEQLAFDTLMQHVERMTSNSHTTIGFVLTNNAFTPSNASKRQPQLMHSMLRAASCELQLGGCICARLIRAMPRVSGRKDFTHSTLIWWSVKNERDINYWTELPASTDIDFTKLCTNVAHCCAIQFFTVPDEAPRQIQ